jgi:hypothetical protein
MAYHLHVTSCGDKAGRVDPRRLFLGPHHQSDYPRNRLSRFANQHAFSGDRFFLSFCTSFSGKNQSISPQVPQIRS